MSTRELATSAEDDARIETCTELAVLEQWLGDAVVATTAAEVFAGAAAT